MKTFKANETFDNRDYLVALFKMLKNVPVFSDRNYHYENFKKTLRSTIRHNTRGDSLCNLGLKYIGGMWGRSSYPVKRYWPESVKEAIKKGNSYYLRTKLDYYFVNGEYFDRDNCFFIDGQIYDRNKYFFDGKRALSREEYFSVYHNNETIYLKKTKKDYLQTRWGDFNIQIKFSYSILQSDFFENILCVGDKLFKPTVWNTGLLWEQIKDLDICISEEMKEILSQYSDQCASVSFNFKNCRKKSHKFLKGLLSGKHFPLKELPTLLKVIKQSLEV